VDAVARRFGPLLRPERRTFVLLVVLALATRMVWVLWVHPPGDYVFSDMRKYLERAQALAEHGFVPGQRTMAWQAWGTHALLAIPLAIFGKNALTAAAVWWGLMAAAAVPLAYLLACRVCARRWMALAVGWAMLLWHPCMSNAGYFLSETPFLCFQLASTLAIVIVLQEGRLGLVAGALSAVAFAVRPQSALFYVLVLATWAINRRALPHVRVRQLAGVALPLVGMLAFSLWRFHAHTGYGPGIAENANMNFTAGRCHNIVTQAFANDGAMRRSESNADTRDGRRVSLPQYRLMSKLPRDHPMALQPALGGETIRFVGYIGDPDIHREIRRRCYERTGVLGQARFTVQNAMLLWFVDRQWPEIERGREWFSGPVEVFRWLFVLLALVPSWIALGWAIARIRRRPALMVVAWQIVVSTALAGMFFGTVRLRTPYDPYALILAVEGWQLLVLAFVRARARLRLRAAGPPPSEGG
jgi:hypothetical protein